MERLRALRNQKGFSLRALAAASGISVAGIVLLEKLQVYDPKISTAMRIARALGVTFDELVDPADVLARVEAGKQGNRRGQ